MWWELRGTVGLKIVTENGVGGVHGLWWRRDGERMLV